MKRIKLLNFFIVTVFLVSFGTHVVIRNNQAFLNELDRYDLFINEEISTIDQEYSRNIPLYRTREIYCLNFTVQNHGDPLESVTLQVRINEQFKTHTYYTREKTSLSEIESYHFLLAQSLYLPLENVSKNTLDLSITLILDSTIDWRSSAIDFQIIHAEIIAMAYNNPLELKSLDIFPTTQLYNVKPEKYSFLEKSLVIHSFIFVISPPTGFFLEFNLCVTLKQLGIESVTINQHRYSGIGAHTLIINHSLSSSEITSTNEIFLLIKPDYNGFDSTKVVEVKLELSGVFKKDLQSYTLLIKHPIPGWIMLPVLILILFGFPYYYAYQEMVVQREKEIIDPTNQNNNY